jgi:hypothetical protein
MMSRYLLGTVAAAVCGLTVSIAAQAPESKPSAQEQANAVVTIEGCVAREQDVPGRKPNIVERAGVMKDYMLTHAKVTAPLAAANAVTSTQPVGTTGSMGVMYDIKELDEKRLEPFVGKRVQIEGTLTDLTKSPSAGPTEDLPDIRALTIRPATGECPR